MFSLFGNRKTSAEVAPKDAAPRIDSWRVIDVREPAELTSELKPIVNAENVPLATVTSQAQSWDRDAPLLVVCRSGGRSKRAADALVGMGFTDVTNLTGGMLAWAAAGLPTR